MKETNKKYPLTFGFDLKVNAAFAKNENVTAVANADFVMQLIEPFGRLAF